MPELSATAAPVPAGPPDYVQLVATDVRREFGVRRNERHTAVDGVSLTVESGEAVGIVGESGSGKSTLARILAGVDNATTGSVSFNGVAIRSQLRTRSDRLALRRSVQMVAQDTSSSFDPLKTLRSSVRSPTMRLLGLGRDEADRRVEETLRSLELAPELADRYPHQVSGGQRQRFALARAIVVRPGMLICDEVVSALDVSVQGAVLNILRRHCQHSGAGLIFVSHGLPATAFVSDRIVVMLRGRIVEDGRTEDVIHRPQHDYTKRLLAAYRGRPVPAGSGRPGTLSMRTAS
ncbi:MAG: ATP-binding cassette domain-containing protein [Gordonia sp. (in: high G+C Gram-positive bacteria)]